MSSYHQCPKYSKIFPNETILFLSLFSEKLWKTIDNLVHQVIHLCESQSSDSFPSDLRNLNDQLNLNMKYVEMCEPPILRPDWNTDKKEKSDMEKIDYNQNTIVENRDEESGDSGTCTDIEFVDKEKSTYDNVVEKVIRDSEKMLVEKKHTEKKVENKKKLKRNSIPQPNRKMKTFHWIKVNENAIGKFIFKYKNSLLDYCF